MPVQRADYSQILKLAARPKVLPIAIISFLPLLLGIIGFSVGGLLKRPHYLDTYGPIEFVKLAYILVPTGLSGAAILLFNSEQRRGKVCAAVLLLFYLTYLFSTGSRAIALIPIVLCGTYLFIPTRAATVVA